MQIFTDLLTLILTHTLHKPTLTRTNHPQTQMTDTHTQVFTIIATIRTKWSSLKRKEVFLMSEGWGVGGYQHRKGSS